MHLKQRNFSKHVDQGRSSLCYSRHIAGHVDMSEDGIEGNALPRRAAELKYLVFRRLQYGSRCTKWFGSHVMVHRDMVLCGIAGCCVEGCSESY